MNNALNIAIVSTNKDKYSETFIYQHVKRLPGNIHFLFDGYFPKQYSRDKGRSSEFFKEDRRNFFTKLFLKKKDAEEERHKEVEAYLVKNNIQLLFCEYGPSGVAMMPLAKQLNIPLLVHFHGYDAYRSDILESYGQQYPELFNTAAAVVCVSQHMRQHLLQLGCPASKLHLAPCGVDLSVFKMDRNAKKDITFVSCGRFVEKKGPNITIRAFARVLPHLPNASLVMIGDGELLDYCKVLTAKLAIKHAVEFPGVLSPQQVASTFNRALVFVQHSITTQQNDSEGTPLTILESGACGLPVVATRHGGIGDVVREGETGFLVNEKDMDAMASAMLLTAQEPTLALEMGAQAAKIIQEHHSIEANIKQLSEIIDRCIK